MIILSTNLRREIVSMQAFVHASRQEGVFRGRSACSVRTIQTVKTKKSSEFKAVEKIVKRQRSISALLFPTSSSSPCHNNSSAVAEMAHQHIIGSIGHSVSCKYYANGYDLLVYTCT